MSDYLRPKTTLSVAVHLASPLDVQVDDLTDTGSSFVSIRLGAVDLYVHTREQAKALIAALKQADDLLAVRDAVRDARFMANAETEADRAPLEV